jgi:hypothetical protein
VTQRRSIELQVQLSRAFNRERATSPFGSIPTGVGGQRRAPRKSRKDRCELTLVLHDDSILRQYFEHASAIRECNRKAALAAALERGEPKRLSLTWLDNHIHLAKHAGYVCHWSNELDLMVHSQRARIRPELAI